MKITPQAIRTMEGGSNRMKSPVGILFAVAGLVLAVSPGARKTARRLVVRGVQLLLDLNNQAKPRTTPGTALGTVPVHITKPVMDIGAVSENEGARVQQ
jgi:hypothetical protein